VQEVSGSVVEAEWNLNPGAPHWKGWACSVWDRDAIATRLARMVMRILDFMAISPWERGLDDLPSLENALWDGKKGKRFEELGGPETERRWEVRTLWWWCRRRLVYLAALKICGELHAQG
jgi:hypothetical protein